MNGQIKTENINQLKLIKVRETNKNNRADEIEEKQIVSAQVTAVSC